MFTQKYRSEISHSTSVSGPGSSPAGKGRRCIVLEAKGETRGRRRCRGRPRGREARPGGPRGPPHHKGRGLGARGQALRARHALSPAQKHSAGSVTELQPAPPQPALPLRSHRGRVPDSSLGFRKTAAVTRPCCFCTRPSGRGSAGVSRLRVARSAAWTAGAHRASIGRPTPRSAGLGHCGLRARASACCGSVGEDTAPTLVAIPLSGPGLSFIDVSAGMGGGGAGACRGCPVCAAPALSLGLFPALRGSAGQRGPAAAPRASRWTAC